MPRQSPAKGGTRSATLFRVCANLLKVGERRIFIAIDISEDARLVVAEYIDELRSQFRNLRVGWEKPEKLHLTLKFIGHVEEPRIAEIETSIAAVAARHRPFAAVMSRTGVFPNAREPRVLWLGVDAGRAEMTALGTDVENAVGELGFVKEHRPFSPHLTIARVREPRLGRALAATHLAGSILPVEFVVDRITIYESVLGTKDSTYTPISRQPLKGN
jgi:2'-5' RNA ligase